MTKLRKEFARSVRNGKYEEAEGGILLPEHKVLIGGVFEHEVIRDGESLGVMRDRNIVVNEGLDHILSVIFNAGTQETTWYVGIYHDNITPVAGDTAASNGWTETTTQYDEANRPTWVEAAPSGQQVTNSASKATFTMNATLTIYGALLIADNVKGGTTGPLMSASKFAASRSVVDNDQLLITYTISAADA
jgi:hypothetical protein